MSTKVTRTITVSLPVPCSAADLRDFVDSIPKWVSANWTSDAKLTATWSAKAPEIIVPEEI